MKKDYMKYNGDGACFGIVSLTPEEYAEEVEENKWRDSHDKVTLFEIK